MATSHTFWSRIGGIGTWALEHIDVVGALVVAIAVSIFSLFDYQENVANIAVLVTLGLLCVVLIRDRDSRESLRQAILGLAAQMQPPSPESFFGDSRSEQPVIQVASRELLIVQETGNKLLTDGRQAMVELLRRHGRVRLVLAAPTEDVGRLMALRNSTLTPEDILNRYNSVTPQLQALQHEAGDSATGFEVRYSCYPLDFTCVISDPSTADPKGSSRALVRLAGFRVPFEQKMDFELDSRAMPGLYSSYANQARAYFHSASKIVLLTGPKRSGKTTLLEEVVSEHMSSRPEFRGSLFTVMSRQILRPDDGERDGFEFVITADKVARRFATKDQKSGRYEVDQDEVRRVAELIGAARVRGQVVVVDEIGPLQLLCPEFDRVVDELLSDPRSCLIGTLASVDSATDYPSTRARLQQMSRHFRTTLLRIDTDREDVRQAIKIELAESLRTMKFLHGT